MTELWKPLPDWPYQVSNLGQVMRNASKWGNHAGKICRPGLAPTGYWRVCLCRQGKPKTVYVHVLVCTAFHGPRPLGLVTRHLDGDKNNNLATNLCWGTTKENASDTIAHGTSPKGVRNTFAKLTETEVRALRARAQDGLTQTALADLFGIDQTTVSLILARKTWAHLQ